uniref:Si:ch211-159i8.4 n=1 Tax=Erpetoichthys calabaricus TaxID=27687 RepID=A0A8C4SJL8_ERPCA
MFSKQVFSNVKRRKNQTVVTSAHSALPHKLSMGLVLNFTTEVQQNLTKSEISNAIVRPAWVLIRRWVEERVKVVLEGSEVSMQCEVISSEEPKFEWILPDMSRANQSHEHFLVSQNGNLVIKNTDTSDAGIYYCLARTENEADLVSFRLIVRELMATPEEANGKEIFLQTGKTLSLPCSTSSVFPTKVRWFIPQNKILLPSVSGVGKYVSSNGTLMITKTTKADVGQYICIAANLYGSDILMHITKINELSIMLTMGRSIYIHCTASGEPEPFLKWTIPSGMHIKPSQSMMIMHGRNYKQGNLPYCCDTFNPSIF